jgi:murein DD-endopeptidase MepM/ murein hydrolase activator NlpD
MAGGNKAVQFGMLTVASVLIYSGIKGVSVMDTLAGAGTSSKLDPAGGQAAALGLQGTPALPTAGVSGLGPTGGKGKAIGYPCAGTHTIGGWQSDNAVDISVPIGTPIFAPEAGKVVKMRAKTDGCGGGGQFAGNQVTIQGQTTSFFLTHLCKVNVKTGDKVRAGQQIGTSGEANGAEHLHFAVQPPANACDYAGVAVNDAQCKVCRI